jgi:small subunit ribosomal protein S20
MANIKSAKKQAKQNIVKRKRNLARRTAIKTSIKKMLDALEVEKNFDKAQELLKEVEAKLARAKSKGVIHARTASRKVSRLAKKITKTKKS